MIEEEKNPWKKRFEREREARKESERLLEEKSFELWKINQELEEQVRDRTLSLEKALEEARNANKTKSDFLTNMSHEIKTPLNSIIGFSKYLYESNSLNEKDSKYASIIESSANSLLSIINDILDYSKIQNKNFEIIENKTDINKLYIYIINSFTEKMKSKQINFSHTIDKDIPKYIFIDEIRLQQVLTNLLSNAVKFSKENSKIQFDIKVIKKDLKEIDLLFSIKDTGIGIPKDKFKSILKPFVQLEQIANKQNSGTGLGLSICTQILKLFKSKLNINSEINKGSTFSFELSCLYEEKKIQEEENTIVQINFDINKISKNLGISENITTLLIEKFKKEIITELDELEVFIKTKDFKNITKKSQDIKTSCLNLGLNNLYNIFEDLEKDKENIQKKFSTIKNSLKSIKE